MKGRTVNRKQICGHGEACAKALLHLLYPPRCVVCDQLLAQWGTKGDGDNTLRGIHPACAKKLYPVKQPVCMHCGRPIQGENEYCSDCSRRFEQLKNPYWDGHPASFFVQGKAVFEYRGDVKKSMYRFKYSNRREYAGFLADAAYAAYGTWMRDKRMEAVVPVPMYRRKERYRGYNQAALFAKEIAKKMELDYAPNLVQRTRSTKPQKELNDVERKNNLKNAFHATDFIVQYRRILLVDDIYTTGSTAEAVAEELCRAGVEEVYFLAACTGKGQ